MIGCTVCHRPTGDSAYLCSSCWRTLELDLRDVAGLGVNADGHPVPSLVDELEASRGRQDRRGGGNIGVVVRSAERPLPYSERAAEAAYVLTSTITTWARDIADTVGHRVEADGVVTAARWLLRYEHSIRGHPAAAECHDEITDAVALVRRTIDTPARLVYLGPCYIAGCERDIHARLGATVAACPACGGHIDLAQRREWLLEVVSDRLATAADIALASPIFLGGQQVGVKTIRSWADRHRIATFVDAKGRRVHRVGEVVSLAASRQQMAA